ncbi:protein CHLOROPLAST IMPORT APPARATUS 2 [Capsicum chacoense]
MCISDTECRSVPPKNHKSKSKSKTKLKKRRKPKYLSLSLELSEKKSEPSDYIIVSSSNGSSTHDIHHQLNLFPLHPENLVDDKDSTVQEENVALFFTGAENSATNLTELLVSSKDEIDSNISTSVPNYMTVSSSEASLTYADTYRGQQGELVRTALRNKEREHSEEEKWVVYSDVVDVDQHSETTRKDEEVSSCPRNKHHQRQQLSLKLDYDEILNAWSDKGPLYLHSESPQIVPDILDDFLTCETPFSSNGGLMGSSAVLYRVPEVVASEQSGGKATEIEEEDLNMKAGRREGGLMGSSAVLYRVPEVVASEQSGGKATEIEEEDLNMKAGRREGGLMGSSAVLYRVPEVVASEQSGGKATEIEEEDLNMKAGRREASVMRYKEKRQNRLFSKTIRYQVRKLNAEKRPRVKGRFVKRD